MHGCMASTGRERERAMLGGLYVHNSSRHDAGMQLEKYVTCLPIFNSFTPSHPLHKGHVVGGKRGTACKRRVEQTCGMCLDSMGA